MKTEKQKKFVCVQGRTPEEFQFEMNTVLSGVADPEIHFPPTMKLTAYILYEEEVTVPEDIRDEYSLRGERYTCEQCPYFERTNDLRRKWHYCVYEQSKTRTDQPACRAFYEQLEDGTIEPRGRR